ncbi:SMR family transporter [Sphingobacterium prati]|uniref:SMR family transporter n=1 Tax=Sphingobacterium prati TaxID=2737006 RepID=UPI001FE78C0C|nr:SMR family transporter [Sphingobacterium prati]
MNWIALIVAGIFEIGWPLGLKMAQQPEGNKFNWIILAVISMTISGGYCFMRKKQFR